ncbi:MAG: hypothetical protein M5T61_21555 [Acidimicrobiia bacterium]|nr:hypothetical protein [Acidimicrobiia bacterium]
MAVAVADPVAERDDVDGGFEVEPCKCPGCRARMRPFTVRHFERWSSRLTLDSGARWEIEPFQLMIVGKVFERKPEVWIPDPGGEREDDSARGGRALPLRAHAGSMGAARGCVS